MGRYFYKHRPLFVFRCPFCKNQAERQDIMKIKIRYENEYQTLEVETTELGRWLNITMSEDESQEDYEKRIQAEIETQFNRPDYNNWHKHNRHIGNVKTRNKNGEVEVNTEEALVEKAADKSLFFKSITDVETQISLEEYCERIHSVLKPATADMVIAIDIYGYSTDEYADLIGDDANNVSHRHRRALKKLNKVFNKTSF